MTLLIEILCAPDDADTLVDALREHGIDTWITLQPIEIAPESLENASVRERVTGRRKRTALRFLGEESALAIVREVVENGTVWHAIDVAAQS